MSKEPTKTVAELLAEEKAELLKEHAQRAEAHALERTKAEVACLRLEKKLAAELGREGVDFAIVFDPDLGEDGLIAVKLGADLAFRKYLDAVTTTDGGVEPEALFHFVAPALVHPTQERYTEIVRRRGFLANRAADALASLHRVQAKKREGKF